MIKLDGIHAYYGTSHILHGIDLSIEKDETVTLLGRNGAGKTTTLRTIMGLVTPKKGKINFRGETINGQKPFQIARKGVAYVPEERSIFTHLSLIENLEIAQVGMRHHLIGDWTVETIFEKFPILAARKTHRGANLSGGEQQMLAIARALMSEPILLLLDEPSEGLAPLIVKELQKVIQEIVTAGITILLVEQNLDMCTALANRHYVMDQGQIMYSGSNDEFIANEEVKNRYLTLSSVEEELEREL